MAWDIYRTTPQRYVEGQCVGIDHSALWPRLSRHENPELLFELIAACEAGLLQGLKDT